MTIMIDANFIGSTSELPAPSGDVVKKLFSIGPFSIIERKTKPD